MNSLRQKLLLVMKECSYIQKDAKNQGQNYTYASAAAVLEKVNESLCTHGIITFVTMELLSDERQEKNGKFSQYVKVKATITLMDSDSEQRLSTEGLGSASDPVDKAIAKAQTMAMKYAWLNCLNISTGDDPEADESVDEKVKPKKFASMPTSKRDVKPISGTVSGSRLGDYLVRYGNVTDIDSYNQLRKEISQNGWNTYSIAEQEAITSAAEQAKRRIAHG